jgi:LacI family transcriptional regulator
MTTLKELAKLLNISVSTVSKALNDSHEISEQTKRRVQELATKLNYKPNRTAQQLKSNKTRTIGVILPTVTNPFFAEVLHGIETEATKNNYDIIVCLSDEYLSKEERSLQLLSNGSVDGFIIAVARESQVKHKSAHFQNVLDAGIPIVLFDRIVDTINCDKVIVNDFQSVYEATRYLIDVEKRKTVLLISNIEELSVGKLRIKGYNKAIEESGLQPQVLKLGQSSEVEQEVYTTLKSNPSIDAIVSIDHITGIVAINMAKKLKRRVPEDLSVIGFGYDHTQLLSSPKISIIHQKALTIGEIATQTLIKQLSSEEHTLDTVVIPSELKLSDSTKKA